MRLPKNETLYITKVRDVKTPTRGTSLSAGIDFYLPKLTDEFTKELNCKNPKCDFEVNTEVDGSNFLVLFPGHRINIPSGIKVHFGKYNQSALIAANKSGLSTKYGIQFTAQVVDADYQGEVHIGIVNLGKDPVKFKEGDKMIQFVQTPVIVNKLEEVSNEEYKELWDNTDASERGEGGFGSTGR